jgi:hypothetical protein
VPGPKAAPRPAAGSGSGAPRRQPPAVSASREPPGSPPGPDFSRWAVGVGASRGVPHVSCGCGSGWGNVEAGTRGTMSGATRRECCCRDEGCDKQSSLLALATQLACLKLAETRFDQQEGTSAGGTFGAPRASERCWARGLCCRRQRGRSRATSRLAQGRRTVLDNTGSLCARLALVSRWRSVRVASAAGNAQSRSGPWHWRVVGYLALSSPPPSPSLVLPLRSVRCVRSRAFTIKSGMGSGWPFVVV